MKRRLFTFVLAALTIGLLGSCSKINERIDGLDKRVYDLENNKIASVEQQIATINQSIADLSTIRTNIQTLMDAKTAMGEDITKLKAADQTLEGKINDLKTYVDTELAKYVTKDWANATFATLAKQAEIITDVEKLKTDLAGLDTKLDQDIANLKTYIEGWVNTQLSAYYKKAEIDVKVGELQAQITTLKEDNETNKTKIAELKSNLDKLTQDLEEAKATIKTEYEAAITAAINENNGTINQTIQSKIDEVNATITALTGRVSALESDVATLKNDVAALKAMIQTVSIIPAYSNGSLKAEDGILTINCVITPKEAAESLTKANFTILTSESEVLTKSALYGTLTIAKDEDLVLDKTNGTATIKVDVSSVLPAEEDKALTVAVNVKNGISDFTTEFVPVTVAAANPIVAYVEIAAKYDGNTETTLRWYKQNLAITDSGKKAWKSDSGSAVKVPGTGEDVVVGDYFQWGTFTGFYGNGAGTDKGLLPYTSFTSTGCGDGSNAFTFESGKQFNEANAPYYSGSAYTKYNATDGKTTLEASDDVASIILGGTWRMPTKDEIKAMKEATYWAWDATDKGYYVYAPNPATDAGKVNNGTGTYNKADALLFFPATGYGDGTSMSNAGTYGYYRSSTLCSGNTGCAYRQFFNDTNVYTDNYTHRRCGISVRPVQDPAATYKAVTSVSLNETSKNITVGGNLQLKATVIQDDATQQGVYWTSDKPAVATVDPYGKVTGVAAGTATITATTVDGSKTTSCTVTVSAPQVTVTFDLNGITGTAPTAQTIASGSKVTKPADPTYANHTFAGWYKTKDATTGALSDLWDFDNGTVTADMTLYAKWTRTMKDLLGSNFPNSSTNSAPEEGAWTNEKGYKAFTYSSGNYFKLDPGNANGFACLTSNQFTRISDGKYVFENVIGSISYGELTLNIENSTLVSIEYKYNGTDTKYLELSGTYTAPTPTTTGTAKRTGDIDVNWVQLWENGPKFAEYNVGVTDGKAESYGGYYAWGGNQDKADDHNTGSGNLTGNDDTATNLWGENWRMPTKAELEALLSSCDVEWMDGSTKKYNNTTVTGLLCKGKGAYASNSVFLPAAGCCSDGDVLYLGNYGLYWSSTPDGSYEAYLLDFNSGNQFVGCDDRSYGFSVRAVLAE